MSNIGKLCVSLPKNVYSLYDSVNNNLVCFGRLGLIVCVLNTNFKYLYNTFNNNITVSFNTSFHSNQWGLLTALIKQIYYGIFKGFTQRLELIGTGFKCFRLSKAVLFKLGFSHNKKYNIDARLFNLQCTTQTSIIVKSSLSHIVYLTAYRIHLLRMPDVYKNKGIQIFDKYLIKKPGKKKK